MLNLESVTYPSYTFALFFVVLLLVHQSPISFSIRKAVLLFASYFFYGAWNPPFVLLLWISTGVDWVLARRIHEEPDQGKKRLYVCGTLAVNLGLLAFFKYAGFFGEIGLWTLEALGWKLVVQLPSFVLPVGISFYTFQTLSYTIDVYRGRLVPARSFFDYALYVSFFPQLVAGPIVRAGIFLPQCEVERRVSLDEMAWGISLLGFGLFQKVVVADALLAPVVDHIYGARGLLSAADAWLGTMAFALQILCDFSGYTTCAIGVALCFGFHLPDNFRAPYAAVGFSDFWRRWHISLSTWLRDYLYIPLGGNRNGRFRLGLALMGTMLLGGLWHGASWTFVIWGALHGLYLIAERILRHTWGKKAFFRRMEIRFILGVTTFLLVCIAWVFFRAQNFEQAFSLLASMFFMTPSAGSILPAWQSSVVLLVLSVLMLLQLWFRHRRLEEVAGALPVWCRSLIVAFFFLAVLYSPGSHRAFIYFQF